MALAAPAEPYSLGGGARRWVGGRFDFGRSVKSRSAPPYVGAAPDQRVSWQRKEPTPVSARVSPIERIRAEIDDLLGSERDLGEVLAEVARLGVRLAMRTAIEAEVTELLGRERDGRGERIRSRRRNGHCPTTVEPTAAPVGLERSKLRGTDKAFASWLVGVGVCRTNALEPLAIAGIRPGPCRSAMSGPARPTRWARRRRGRSRPSVGYASRSRTSSTPGGPGFSPTGARVPVLGRLALLDARRRSGRAGAHRLAAWGSRRSIR